VKNNLGNLADPFSAVAPLDLTDVSLEIIQHYYRSCLTIRFAEETLARARQLGEIGGPVHLGIGQEAVSVGVASVLNSDDRIYGAHRSHAQFIAMGGPLSCLFSEILGRKSGVSRGFGGSMHLIHEASGFGGSVPIVGGTVAIAVGAAMAFRLRGVSNMAVAFFGDGACEEGVIHESLNLASVQGEPILFVVENNLFASHMDLEARQPNNSMCRFAEAHEIPYALVDGNDVVQVSRAARQASDLIRSGAGPFFIEAVTYRWLGHVDWRADIDVGLSRSQSHIDAWKARDPVGRLKQAIMNSQKLDETDLKAIEIDAEKSVRVAWELALTDDLPDPDCLAQVSLASSERE